MKVTGNVRRIEDLGSVVIPREIRRTFPIRVGDPSQISWMPWEEFCFRMSNLAKRKGRKLYIVMKNSWGTAETAVQSGKVPVQAA